MFFPCTTGEQWSLFIRCCNDHREQLACQKCPPHCTVVLQWYALLFSSLSPTKNVSVYTVLSNHVVTHRYCGLAFRGNVNIYDQKCRGEFIGMQTVHQLVLINTLSRWPVFLTCRSSWYISHNFFCEIHHDSFNEHRTTRLNNHRHWKKFESTWFC